MSEKRFSPGDWVTIKSGEYSGCYGRVCMREKSGSYIVLPYDKEDEPQAMNPYLAENLEWLEPYVLEPKELKELLTGRLFYKDISDRVFPPFNLKVKRAYKLKAKDISTALKNINVTDTPLTTFKEWFWLIINVFYEKLDIAERYDESGLMEDPANEDELFSDVYGITEKLYWRLEDRFSKKEDNEKYFVKFRDEPRWDEGALNDDSIEKEAYLTVCSDIISRVSIYERNKRNPDKPKQYSLSQKKIYVSDMDDAALACLDPESLEKYRSFLFELAENNDAQALRILAWSYYEGSAAFTQNWKESEKWLHRLYDYYGDPFAANSLGYIYYYGRTSKGVPDYERAFKYFSFGALSGIDESIYKCGDMLIHGKGTTRNIDMGVNMIVDGYRACLDEFCFGDYLGKFADYALRMGNICRDKLIYGMGMRDAYKFYLEADFAIKKRMAEDNQYGDKKVAATIEREIEKIQDRLGLDLARTELRADFPIYMNQLFEDIFPLHIYVTPDMNGGFLLRLQRYRIDKELTADFPLPDRFKEAPAILVCYPELSYANLVTELSFRLENVSVVKVPEEGEFFIADGFRKNEHTNAIEFFCSGEFTAAIEAEWYVIDISTKNDL